jgi:hypothetical protein
MELGFEKTPLTLTGKRLHDSLSTRRSAPRQKQWEEIGGACEYKA